jgi:hypothetical protein
MSSDWVAVGVCGKRLSLATGIGSSLVAGEIAQGTDWEERQL